MSIDPQSLTATISILAEIVVINVVLSGDNAIVIGMAAASLPPAQRLKTLWLGIAVATVLRVIFSLVATRLLRVFGLLLAGGFLLLWVAWKLWREIAPGEAAEEQEAEALLEGHLVQHAGRTKTFREALWQIVVADISMSLDNVLAVAGAALEHPVLLTVGLGISVLLMGAAASLVAKLLERHRWIAYGGLLLIVYIALKMIWAGTAEVLAAMAR